MVDFTTRQQEIYDLLIHGKSYHEVATELNLTYRTIRFHTERMAAKIPGNGAALRKILAYAVENAAENGHI